MDLPTWFAERAQALWASIPFLLLMMLALLGWFPGHNAARHGHPRAGLIQVAGWWWVLGGTFLASHDLFGHCFAPLLVLGWLMVLTWSYGKHPVFAVSPGGRGFEVLAAVDEPVACPDGPPVPVRR